MKDIYLTTQVVKRKKKICYNKKTVIFNRTIVFQGVAAMTKNHQETEQLVKGAFILTIAALIIKVLSALYRVPFQNIVGDVGFYIYQQVYPFYGIAIVLGTQGFPVIISKLYAEFAANNDRNGQRKLLQAAAIVLTSVGILLFFSLFIGATAIASWMNDQELTPLIRAVAFVFLFLPIIALLRGMYQGRGNMVPTAISQVAEQLVRVSAILIVSFYLVQNGYSLYETGAGAIYSSVAGLFVSTLILLLFFIGKKEWQNKGSQKQAENVASVSLGRLVKTLLIQGLAVCMSAMMLILLQLVDALNLYAQLVSSGIDEAVAKELKGVYDRGQPLIQLGTVVATSIALAVTPFIARAKARNDEKELEDKIRLTLQVSTVIGVGAAIGLFSIITPTNKMLFQNDAGSDVLAVLSLMIAFTAAIMAIVAVLQGIGTIIFPAVVIVVGTVVKYGLNVFLVPQFGTIGGAFASIGALLFILLCLIIQLKRVTGKLFLSRRFVIVTTVGALGLLLLLYFYLSRTNFLYTYLASERIAASLQALSAALFGGCAYVIYIVRRGIFSEAELQQLPFGHKLVLFLQKNKRS